MTSPSGLGSTVTSLAGVSGARSVKWGRSWLSYMVSAEPMAWCMSRYSVGAEPAAEQHAGLAGGHVAVGQQPGPVLRGVDRVVRLVTPGGVARVFPHDHCLVGRVVPFGVEVPELVDAGQGHVEVGVVHDRRALEVAHRQHLEVEVEGAPAPDPRPRTRSRRRAGRCRPPGRARLWWLACPPSRCRAGSRCSGGWPCVPATPCSRRLAGPRGCRLKYRVSNVYLTGSRVMISAGQVGGVWFAIASRCSPG